MNSVKVTRGGGQGSRGGGGQSGRDTVSTASAFCCFTHYFQHDGMHMVV